MWSSEASHSVSTVAEVLKSENESDPEEILGTTEREF